MEDFTLNVRYSILLRLKRDSDELKRAKRLIRRLRAEKAIMMKERSLLLSWIDQIKSDIAQKFSRQHRYGSALALNRLRNKILKGEINAN